MNILSEWKKKKKVATLKVTAHNNYIFLLYYTVQQKSKLGPITFNKDGFEKMN